MIDWLFLQEKIFPYADPQVPPQKRDEVQEIYRQCAENYAKTEPKKFLANTDFHYFDETTLVLLATLALNKIFNIEPVHHKPTASICERTPTIKRQKTIYSPEYFDRFAVECPDLKLREALARQFTQQFGEGPFNLFRENFKLS